MFDVEFDIVFGVVLDDGVLWLLVIWCVRCMFFCVLFVLCVLVW